MKDIRLLRIGIFSPDSASAEQCLIYIRHQLLSYFRENAGIVAMSRRASKGKYLDYCRIRIKDGEDYLDIVIEVCPFTENSRGKRFHILIGEDICKFFSVWRDSLSTCLVPNLSKTVYYRIQQSGLGEKFIWNSN